MLNTTDSNLTFPRKDKNGTIARLNAKVERYPACSSSKFVYTYSNNLS